MREKGGNEVGNTLLQEAEAMKETLVEWRRDLHQIPELDLQLPKTVTYVTERLKEMGIEYQVVAGGSTVIALLGKGSKRELELGSFETANRSGADTQERCGRCFMLRSDMDALPVVEEAEVDFASVNGCMHGCGHDLHTAILLGAAKLLKVHEEEMNGTVKLLFQAGEETFRGARAAIAAGVLENPHVDAAFGMHVMGNTSVGIVKYGRKAMASAYGFKIILTGHGGHGSQPELCIDPIGAGVQVYLALQSLVARECPATAEAALTIGQFTAGNASNVIPEICTLQGTLRTFDNTLADHLIRRINEIVPAVAAAYRVKCEIEELCRLPGVVCDESLIHEVAESIQKIDPSVQMQGNMHWMASEDFALYAEAVPAGYFMIGAGVEDEDRRYGQHNPKIVFHEDCLPLGAAVYAGTALDWLERHGFR